MAGASLLTLIDDIATVLDDVAVLTKVAAKKTSGVIGDDLALNAQQLVGMTPEKELPVIWAVFKGSLKNKLILVPTALAISYFLPWLILPLLMLGGAFLCFEGVEKIYEKFFHKGHEVKEVVSEEEKIKGAIRTDFILSAEIIVITLGSVAGAVLTHQILVLSTIALAMTVGVYGFVALIVKLDDIGLRLTQVQDQTMGSSVTRKIGMALVSSAPYLMKVLGFVGTIAMFLVGGGILTHGIPALHHGVEGAISNWSPVLKSLAPMAFDGLFGVLAGAILVVLAQGVKKVLNK